MQNQIASVESPVNGKQSDFVDYIGSHNDANNADDDDDVIIETEEIIYPNAANGAYNGSSNSHDNHIFDGLMSNLRELKLLDSANAKQPTGAANGTSTNGKCTSSENGEGSLYNSDAKASSTAAPEKLRYKQKYGKTDPNIVIEYCTNDNIMVALKLLFSWLRANNNILLNCFATNPEFIDKIFDLFNRINIDVFTRKVYLERHHIRASDVRDDLRTLFDIRHTIPLKEDVVMKEFPIFDMCQRYLDWSLPLSMKITENEEAVLRIFGFVDFGFALCKMKKFSVSFCSRSRRFEPLKTERNSTRKTRKRGRRNRKSQRDRPRNRRDRHDDICLLTRDDESAAANDDAGRREPARPDGKTGNLKKGYLKSRQQLIQKSAEIQVDGPVDAKPAAKTELMGKLWLQHEIEVLETKTSKSRMILPPYVIVDTKALTNQLEIVKRLVKTKKTVVLIPKAGERC